MQTTKVEQDQFRWDTNSLIHIPTGATFSWKYPNSGSADVIINWKFAADVLPNGQRFDPEEIETVARRLIRHEAMSLARTHPPRSTSVNHHSGLLGRVLGLSYSNRL